MVELSEKLIFPSLGALTGFVSASSGTEWETTPFRASATLLASFVAPGNCVKRMHGVACFYPAHSALTQRASFEAEDGIEPAVHSARRSFTNRMRTRRKPAAKE
jgi:hypothetical protein